MTPIALSDDALLEILAAGQLVPVQSRAAFLEAVARELAEQPVVGAGNAHRIAFRIAAELQWDAAPRRVSRTTAGEALVNSAP